MMSNHNLEIKIGIDLGGVIISQDTDEPDLFFSDSFLKVEPFQNSFLIIQNMIQTIGQENVFIISKCGEKIQKKSIEWLEHKRFFEITKFNPKNIYFCLERYQKAEIAQTLHLTHFIDDRYSVLKYMIDLSDIQKLILFCPKDTERELSQKQSNPKIIELNNWIDINNFF